MSRTIASPRLHVLTAPDQRGGDLRVVDAVLAAGAPAVQIRLKGGGSDRDRLATTLAIVARCREFGTVSIVNDRVDLALAADADGVHLGADDLPLADARRMADDRLLIGGTARDPATARRLVREGADYLGVGPTYATTTKDGLPEPLGPAGIGVVAAAVDVPVIAIAGITATRIPEILAAGAHGVAVVGAVNAAADPGAAVRELLAAMPPASRS